MPRRRTAFRLRAAALVARAITVATLLALAPVPAAAWGATGHMVVAEIAYRQLTPEARAEADRLIGVLRAADPRTGSFVPAAVWMDEIRGSGLRAFDTWHYINLPINADGLAAVPPALDTNVVWGIEQMAGTLADPEAQDFERAFALRVLLHLVGDIHQPLHCVGRCTLENPQGDRGGNLFFIEPACERCPSNLHWLWDGSVGLFPRIDPEGEWRQPVAELATSTIAACPPPPDLPAWSPGAAEAWARESFALALTVAYDGVEEGERPSAAYLERAQRAVEQRIALAGYRLAAILEATLLRPRPPPVPRDRD